MSKPDWSESPQWAQFLAMDPNGEWWWYEKEPYWRDDCNRWGVADGHAISHMEHMASKVHGNGTLERRP